MIDNEMADYAEAMNRELKAQRDELLAACKGFVRDRATCPTANGKDLDAWEAMEAAIANVEKRAGGEVSSKPSIAGSKQHVEECLARAMKQLEQTSDRLKWITAELRDGQKLPSVRMLNAVRMLKETIHSIDGVPFASSPDCELPDGFTDPCTQVRTQSHHRPS